MEARAVTGPGVGELTHRWKGYGGMTAIGQGYGHP